MIPENLSLEEFKEAMDRTSLLHWLPSIRWRSIVGKSWYEIFIPDEEYPFPKTLVIHGKFYGIKLDADILPIVPDDFIYNLKNLINEYFSYPIFIRGDYGSSKFQWCKTCYVEDESLLHRNLLNLLYHQLGLEEQPVNALVVREYIKPYKIFDVDLSYKGGKCKFPLALEVRAFIQDGKPLGWTKYWVKDAVNHNWGRFRNALPPNWEKLYDEKYVIAEDDLAEIRHYIETGLGIVADKHGWSIDFMKGEDGRWYLIDMADIRLSWKPDKLHPFPK